MPDHPPSPIPLSSGLLIAVTGGPGSSKTRTLAELASSQLARGQYVEGVLAIAGTRREPNRGASEYWVRTIGQEQESLWAVRDDALDPPYRFEPDTTLKLQAWAKRLKDLPPADLMVLDEFGKFEARGLGLMPLWPDIVAANPRIVAIATRDIHIPVIEQRIGRKFDLQISASDPAALSKLQRACEDYGEWTRLGLYGGAAGGIEMTVGSALHAAKVPLRGLAMSSLQAAMMVFAGTGLAQPGRVVWVPFISGGLKALSPAGNRVRPMIAIIMQGLLFGTSVQALGWNFFAIGIGGALVGAWAALQGFALQYLMIGKEMFKAYDTIVLWLAEKWNISAPGLPWLVGAWAILHASVSCGIALTAWRLRRPPEALQKIIDRETTRVEHGVVTEAGRPIRTGWRRRVREFSRWQFWLPLVVVSAILLGSGGSWETIAWLFLRFIAVSCVLIALISLLRPARWAEKLRRRGWWGPAVALDGAIQRRRGK
ncbi:hypothetical protein [Oleiharenicola lentus]|uniref:hypothetical protein n=1 Tax=Oleiharenicola lentus TaxID=2508720 RepID=UPI003F672E05